MTLLQRGSQQVGLSFFLGLKASLASFTLTPLHSTKQSCLLGEPSVPLCTKSLQVLVLFCKKRVYGEEEKTDSLPKNYSGISETLRRSTGTPPGSCFWLIQKQVVKVNEALN